MGYSDLERSTEVSRAVFGYLYFSRNEELWRCNGGGLSKRAEKDVQDVQDVQHPKMFSWSKIVFSLCVVLVLRLEAVFGAVFPGV
jgi:hypothetical protein